MSKKTKPQEKTTKKRKKGKFDDSFITFTKEDGMSYFNYWVIANSITEKDKIVVEIIPPSKKAKLLMEIK